MDSWIKAGFAIKAVLGGQARRFLKSEDGVVIVFLAAASIVLVGAAGLAYDSGRGYLLQARLNQAVDAAALAGGRSLTAEGEEYEAQILKYLRANLPEDFMGASFEEPVITLSGGGDRITVEAAAVVPTTLMRVVQINSIRVSASATVNREVTGLELALVLDNSTSMGSSGKMQDLEDAVEQLLDILYGDRDTVDDLYVSIVPFAGRTNLKDYPKVHPEDPLVEDLVCLDERREPYEEPYAAIEASPVAEAFEHYSGEYEPTEGGRGNGGRWGNGGNNSIDYADYADWICPEAPVLGLTQSRETLDRTIREMEPAGCTRFDVGTAWGWRTLSEEWRGFWDDDNLPLDYGEREMGKAIVIMTDGENTPRDYCKDDIRKNETLEMFRDLCREMKATNRGIVVYTITFQLDDPETNQLFTECASGDHRSFKSTDGDKLEEAFITIGNDLSLLRLTH